MEPMRFLVETIIEWARDTLVNLSGRVIEEFVGKRMKRRRRRLKRRLTPKDSQ